jgi:hypothetical protein
MGVKVTNRTTTPQPGPLGLAVKAGLAAALAAALLAGHLPEPLIILAVIVASSFVGWHRVQLAPVRVRSHHRFTVVSRSGDEFVTVDAAGARRVTRTVVVDGTAS